MRQFNRYLLLLIFLSSGLLSKAQFDNVAYDKEKFLIGTLNEYMGYLRTFTSRDTINSRLVDRLNEKDVRYAVFIDSLFAQEYPDILIMKNEAPQSIILYSPSLSKKIDDYYLYEPSGMHLAQDTLYEGNPIKERFETKKDKLSFLLGAYLRYGKNKEEVAYYYKYQREENMRRSRISSRHSNQTSNVYGLVMINSPSKSKLCAELLNELKCKNIGYLMSPTIPNGYFVFFEPSSSVKKMIKEADRLEKYIESIDDSHVVFTPEGKKFIRLESRRRSSKNAKVSEND